MRKTDTGCLQVVRRLGWVTVVVFWGKRAILLSEYEKERGGSTSACASSWRGPWGGEWGLPLQMKLCDLSTDPQPLSTQVSCLQNGFESTVIDSFHHEYYDLVVLFFFFNWSIVDLQCCVNFFCTAWWLSYACVYTFFFILFCIMVYLRILGTVFCTVGPCLSTLYITVCTC